MAIRPEFIHKFSYPVLLPRRFSGDAFLEVDEWMWEIIGEEEKDFEYNFWPVDSYILFKRDEDRFKFILRWL